jgi:hypothetical protein
MMTVGNNSKTATGSNNDNEDNKNIKIVANKLKPRVDVREEFKLRVERPRHSSSG